MYDTPPIRLPRIELNPSAHFTTSRPSSPLGMTALSTTWSMCTSAMDNVIPVTDHHNVQPPQTSQASSNRTLPAPSPEVLDVLRGLMRPDVQCYLTKLVEAFTDGQPDNTAFRVNKTRRPLYIDQHISNETQEHLDTLPQDSAPQMVCNLQVDAKIIVSENQSAYHLLYEI
ncbi:uncharacterized protein LOC125667640 [Ostrea edulis]|uniref:uncharacterized protein LOC125667640 n=1 Tax=Ostrea edulis TaxID=37623 RepID=UPI0024AF3757|nr:uncharacterized protein LOC125667640 [Ostrea edulis]